MANEPFSLTKLFGKVAKGGLLLAATEVIIFTLVHANTGGMALMATITPHINGLFNATGITNGMYALSEAFGGGPATMAAQVGGQLLAAPGGGSMLLPALPGT
jgi:hypothetical protein